MTIFLWNLDRFKKITGRFLGKFVVKWILKIPPHLAHLATLPCETLVSAKQAINDNLQSSVATYLACGGVVQSIQSADVVIAPLRDCSPDAHRLSSPWLSLMLLTHLRFICSHETPILFRPTSFLGTISRFSSSRFPILIFFLFLQLTEWLACWTEAQKGLGSNRSRGAVG